MTEIKKQIDLNIEDYVKNSRGIFYILDRDLQILHYTDNYNIQEKNRNNIDYVGSNFADQLVGGEIREFFITLYDKLFQGSLSNFMYKCHCNGPEMVRDNLITFTPIIQNDEVISVIHHSLIYSERPRPAVQYLRPNKQTKDGPLVKICAKCGKTKKDGEWLTSTQYYQAGGIDEVSLTHGYCPTCFQELYDELERLSS